jgi:hypothetical protein
MRSLGLGLMLSWTLLVIQSPQFGIAAAKHEGKPLMAVLRCIP